MKTILKSKKRALLSGVLAILLLATAGATIALLMHNTQNVTNTFQPTEVTCKVNETFENNTKSQVRIENTGVVDAYIRAAVIITLRDAEGNVAPIAANESHYTAQYGTYWLKGNDGYYYYPNVVKSGEKTGNVLIESISPTSAIPDGYVLSVEIIADAIQADGEVLETGVVGEKGKKPVELAWNVIVNADGTISK